MRYPVLVLALCLPLMAVAQVYRCQGPKGITYQDFDCKGSTLVDLSGAGEYDPDSPAAAQLQREMDRLTTQENLDRVLEAMRTHYRPSHRPWVPPRTRHHNQERH
jgi:hypothetical protein